jgi:hypothetical protein
LCCKPVHRHRKRGSSQNNESRSDVNRKTQNNHLNMQLPQTKMNYPIGTPKTPINGNNRNNIQTTPSIMMHQHQQQQQLNGNVSSSNIVHQMALYNPLVMMNVLASSSPLNYQQKPLYLPIHQQQQQQLPVGSVNPNFLQNPYYYQNFIREYLQHQQQIQQQNNDEMKQKHIKKDDEIIKHKNDSVYYGDDDEENNYSLESEDLKQTTKFKNHNNDEDDNLDDDDDEDDCINDEEDDDEDVSIDIEDINENNNHKNNVKKNNKENLLIASSSSASSTIIGSKLINSNNYKFCDEEKLAYNKKRLENSTGSTTESYTSSYTDSFNYSNGNAVVMGSHNIMSKNSSTSPSSSVSPYYSASSSTNSSNSNTPNTQIYVGSNCGDHSENKSLTKKKLETKKINFAVISSLVD